MRPAELDAILTTWIQQGGSISFLAPPERKSGLRKPYSYCVPARTYKAAIQTLRDQFAKTGAALQCCYVETKAVAFGSRLNLFALGYKPGFCGGTRGIGAEAWDELASGVFDSLQKGFGKDVPLYCERWSETQKFQMRFETYVQFEELIKLR